MNTTQQPEALNLEEFRAKVTRAAREPLRKQAEDGWIQDGHLLYRLTDGHRPRNRDEINVTMANSSRTEEARTRRASELLHAIRAAAQQAVPASVIAGAIKRIAELEAQLSAIGAGGVEAPAAPVSTYVEARECSHCGHTAIIDTCDHGHKFAKLGDHPGNSCVHCLRIGLTSARAEVEQLSVNQEPVGWQFYQDGEWWHGDDRIKDRRKNTEEAGFRVRDVYATPQPELLTVDVLVGALEQVIKAAPSSGPLWHGSEQIVEARIALTAHRKQGGGR